MRPIPDLSCTYRYLSIVALSRMVTFQKKLYLREGTDKSLKRRDDANNLFV